MKLIILILLFSHIANGTVLMSGPSHWDDLGFGWEGTNYVDVSDTTIQTNYVDILSGIYTNIIEVIVNENQYAIDGAYPQQLNLDDANFGSYYPSSFVSNLTSGTFQSLPLDIIDDTLLILHSNLLHSYSGYMEWGISPSNFNNIVDLPLFTTNGLIVKQFNSDFIPDENFNAYIGFNFPEGLWTDYFILDGNSLLRIDAFASYNSEDIIFTSNYVQFVETDAPILQYYTELTPPLPTLHSNGYVTLKFNSNLRYNHNDAINPETYPILLKFPKK